LVCTLKKIRNLDQSLVDFPCQHSIERIYDIWCQMYCLIWFSLVICFFIIQCIICFLLVLPMVIWVGKIIIVIYAWQLQIPHLRPTEYKRSRLPRNRRTVNRAYGGVLSGGAVRERFVRLSYRLLQLLHLMIWFSWWCNLIKFVSGSIGSLGLS